MEPQTRDSAVGSTASRSQPTVLIVADSAIRAHGIAHLLRGDARIGNIISAAVDETTLETQDGSIRATPDAFDVVVIDSDSFRRSALVAYALSLCPGARAIVAGADDDPGALLACARAGATGYVPRAADEEELVEAIVSVHASDVVCPIEVARVLVAGLQSECSKESASAGALLTPREAEVAAFLQQGASTKAIASQLCIEPQTVKNYAQSIFRKLNVHSRHELSDALLSRLPLAAPVGQAAPLGRR